MNSPKPKVELLNTVRPVPYIPLKYEVSKTYKFKMKINSRKMKANPNEPNAGIMSECRDSLVRISKFMQKYDDCKSPVVKQSVVVEEKGKRPRGLYHLHSLKIIPKCEHKIPPSVTPLRVEQNRRTYGKNNTTNSKNFVKVFVREENVGESFEPEYDSEVVRTDRENFLKRRVPDGPRYLNALPPLMKTVRMEQPKKTYEKKQKKNSAEMIVLDVDCDTDPLSVVPEKLNNGEERNEINVFINDEDQKVVVKEEEIIDLDTD